LIRTATTCPDFEEAKPEGQAISAKNPADGYEEMKHLLATYRRQFEALRPSISDEMIRRIEATLAEAEIHCEERRPVRMHDLPSLGELLR
jgi:hypothetical protein